MKKFTKICLIAAAVCIFLGGGMSIAAAAMGVSQEDLRLISYHSTPLFGLTHWDSSWYEDEEEWEEDWKEAEEEWDDAWNEAEEEWDDAWNEAKEEWKENVNGIRSDTDDMITEVLEEVEKEMAKPLVEVESQTFTGITELDVDVKGGIIQIIPQDTEQSDQITVRVGDGDGTYRLNTEGSKLCIDLKLHNYGKKERVKNGRRIQILIPNGFRFREADFDMNAGVGDISGFAADDLDLSMNAGILLVRDGTADTLDCKVNAGELYYNGTALKSVEAECNAGHARLDLAAAKEDYNYEINAMAGVVTVDKDSYTGLKNKRTLENTGALAHMELESKAGVLEVLFE